MKRGNYIRKIFQVSIALLFLGTYACKEVKTNNSENAESVTTIEKTSEPFFKLSLAQWSINKMIREGGVDPYKFAEKAKNMGFKGLEYVSQLYPADLENNEYSAEAMASFVEKCNAEAKKHGMTNVLIMIDRQGNLAVDDAIERQEAVERHYKWVDAAAAMGCHAIRVNLAGSSVPEDWKKNSVDGLSKLSAYAKTKNINVIVENHGGLSSNGALLADVMKTVNMDNCGTLPDFGNFCTDRNEDWSCNAEYDKYKGVSELMPYAKAVSAKSHDFDAGGNAIDIDYKKLMKTVKDAGYTGFIGVEYEGSILDEEAGIKATKDLMLKVAKELK